MGCLDVFEPTRPQRPTSEFLCSLQMCAHSNRKAPHLDQVCHSQWFHLPDSLQNCSHKPITSSCRNRGSPHPLVTINPAFHSLCSSVCHKGNPHVAPHSVQCLCPYTHPLHYVTNKLLSISPVQYQSVRCSTNLNYFGQRISHLLTERGLGRAGMGVQPSPFVAEHQPC